MLEFVNSVPGFHDLPDYDKRLIILERYLTTYLDFKWNADDPIGKLLETSKKEDFRTNSRQNLRIDQYLANEIKETYGFDLITFLQLPTHLMENLLEKQRKALKERREMAEKAKREAARQQGGLALPTLGANMHGFNPL